MKLFSCVHRKPARYFTSICNSGSYPINFKYLLGLEVPKHAHI